MSSNETGKKQYKFGLMDLLFAFLSVVFFIVDVVSDALVAGEYYEEGMMWQFGLTLFFVIVPSFIICINGLLLYVGDLPSDFRENIRSVKWSIRFIMTILMMGPVISNLENIFYGLKSRIMNLSDKKCIGSHPKIMRAKHWRACYLHISECYLEAAPQLLIQICIFIQQWEDETRLSGVIRALAIFSSWISLSWSLVTFEKASVLIDNITMTILGMALYFLWRGIEIGTRVLAIGLFAAHFTYYVSIVIGVHWLLMFLWLLYQDSIDKYNSCKDRAETFPIACAMVFCFMNHNSGRTRYKMIFYYTVVYVENLIMVCLWFFFTDDKGAWFHIPPLIIVALALLLQLIFQLMYFKFKNKLSRENTFCPDLEQNEASREHGFANETYYRRRKETTV